MFNILNSISGRHSDLLKKCGLSLLFLTFAVYKLTNTTADPDLWGYMAFGKSFWEQGKFLYQDIFSYLPSHSRWIYHEWLTGVIFFPLYQAMGALGLQLLKYSLGLSTLLVIYMTARQRSADHYATIFILFAISGFLEFGYSPVRAQVFTFFFLALTLYILETARITSRWKILLWLIPIQVIWCNLHGGFLVGLGLLGLYMIGELVSRKPFIQYVGILFLSSLATLINPYGIEYWIYLIRAIPMPRPELTEWASVYTSFSFGILNNYALLYLFLLSIFLVLLLWWLKRWEPTAYIGLAVTLYLGLMHHRHINLFLVFAGIYMPVWLTTFLQTMKSDVKINLFLQRAGWKIPSLVGALLIFFWSGRSIVQDPLSLKLPLQPDHDNKYSMYYPVGAVDYIKKNFLSGNILTEFSWGEYLIWELYPRCLVALDGRFEQVYPEHITREYFDFIFGRSNWKQFLDKYPTDMILIPSGSSLCSLIQNASEWQKTYADQGSALFVKNARSNS